jgi:hypothetical protein
MHSKLRIALTAAAAAALAPWAGAHASSVTVAIGGNQSAVMDVGGCRATMSITETPEQTSAQLAPAVVTLATSVEFDYCPQNVVVAWVQVTMGDGVQSCTGTDGGRWGGCSIASPGPGEYVMSWRAGFLGITGTLPACSPSGQVAPDSVCTGSLQTMVYPAGLPDPCARITCTVDPSAEAVHIVTA